MVVTRNLRPTIRRLHLRGFFRACRCRGPHLRCLVRAGRRRGAKGYPARKRLSDGEPFRRALKASALMQIRVCLYNLYFVCFFLLNPTHSFRKVPRVDSWRKIWLFEDLDVYRLYTVGTLYFLYTGAPYSCISVPRGPLPLLRGSVPLSLGSLRGSVESLSRGSDLEFFCPLF